jgi:hypothetical protein
MNNEQTDLNRLKTLASVLGGAFLINFVFICLWFSMMLISPSYFGIAEKWFGINKHESDLINYTGIAIFKMMNIVFFLAPYLAVKLHLKRENKTTAPK